MSEEVTNEVELASYIRAFEARSGEAMDHAIGAAIDRWRACGVQALGVDFAIVVERV